MLRDYNILTKTVVFPCHEKKCIRMSTISINLPDSVVSAVTERAQKNGFVDVGEYVSQMITRISQRQTEVEDLAIEGIESGPSEPWSSSEIESIRNGLRAKFGK